jgi:ssDNA-binding Zn-finger/Zn-ribbon topoisomerase 1
MPEVADIFRDWSDVFKTKNAYGLKPVHYRAIDDIIKCRTPAMGFGTLSVCSGCGVRRFTWQSCGNRNCPKCGTEKVTRWLQRRSDEILPVDYYMITFTLPQEFHMQCRSHPETVYDLFFKTAAAALKELALDKKYLGAIIGMMATLQTWRRDGEFHPHIHVLIPAGGVSPDKKYWLYPKNRNFLIHHKPLAARFKKNFKDALKKNGLSALIAPAVWYKKWVVDVRNVGNGMSSFKYVAPYMQRGFISNKRIKKYDGESVTFEYHDRKSSQIKSRTLPALDFMSLYLQHVMPSGFMKTRYYGLESSANKKKRRAIRLMILLSRSQPPPEKEVFTVPPRKCKKCGKAMRQLAYHIRPPPGGL